MKVKQFLAFLPAVAALSAQAHASANVAGLVQSTVASTAPAVTSQPLSLLPCVISPENATVLLVFFGAAGLLAGYQLRRVKQSQPATLAS